MGSVVPGARIHYTTDGREPAADSPRFTGPFVIDASTTLKARSLADGFPPSLVISASFIALPEGMRVILTNRYSTMYAAGGDFALIDGIRGGTDFRSGAWQGYHGVDLEAVVDLGAVRAIERIATGFLQDIHSWIFMPAAVEYAVSGDGVSFEVVAVVENDVPPDVREVVVEDFECGGLGARGRFVRVHARSIGVCPAWHPGAGERAWIFADEIVVE
jgi:hypothetical protein